MVLFDSYHHDESKDRNVLSLPARLAPYQVAIFPLVKNKPELLAAAQQLYQGLKQKYRSAWDDRGNIGKRYLSQDEVGTPFCITVDYQTLEDQTVTLRERDSSEQKRVAIAELDQVLASLLS
ncbi:Glycine--tRNA ligase [bioreactor metagenome]|uniref:Glycine--tRNA ligase n=1 Tax=bioreactor metagenome TaxID=1076179 RepID=A0A645BYN8_9ZZZZ